MMAGSEAPIGRNILDLVNIQQSENYSCIAASTLGTIEATTFVRVQGTSFRSPFCSSLLLVYWPSGGDWWKFANIICGCWGSRSRRRDTWMNGSWNNCGTSVIRVRFAALPAAPTDVSISEVTATAVHLEWSYKGPEDLQYYVIQYKRKNANQVSAGGESWTSIAGNCSSFRAVLHGHWWLNGIGSTVQP